MLSTLPPEPIPTQETDPPPTSRSPIHPISSIPPTNPTPSLDSLPFEEQRAAIAYCSLHTSIYTPGFSFDFSLVLHHWSPLPPAYQLAFIKAINLACSHLPPSTEPPSDRLGIRNPAAPTQADLNELQAARDQPADTGRHDQFLNDRYSLAAQYPFNR